MDLQKQRFHTLNYLVNPSYINTLKKRFKIISFLRNTLVQLGYYEVDTPILCQLAGGANARPFLTRSNSMNMDLELRISPELYLKELVISGFHKVSENSKISNVRGKFNARRSRVLNLRLDLNDSSLTTRVIEMLYIYIFKALL